MSTSTPRLRRPTKLILDYDGTLTVNDTMAVLGSLPKQAKKSWHDIVAAYMKDFDAYQTEPYPWKDHGRAEYSRWLAGRKWVEQNSAQRVQDAAFFRGVTLDEVKASVRTSIAEGKLELRDGWHELFSPFLVHYDPVDGTCEGSAIEILSVNWSETAIRQSLHEFAAKLDHPQRDRLCSYINDMRIFANEIEGLGSERGSSGRVVRPLDADIRSSDDKLRHLNASRDAAEADTFVVYVGDSSTDFDCLAAADLGIWMWPGRGGSDDDHEKASKETFAPLDFVPPRLDTLHSLDDEKAMFYWTSDLKSVVKLLTST
jgi:hypothetical protein